jgi:HD-GYP domain-containing protein (c-di-GMP phosphodiesterase class II)
MKDRQRAAIHAHPEQAVQALRAGGVTDVDWLMAVAHHHERPDGTGYPLGLGDVSDIGIALRVNDVFMAKISPRVLRPALSSQEAARQLFREDKGGPVSMAIIKEFGIYPPGDFVTLASGEHAVVVRRTDNAKAPIVAAITDTAGHPIVKTVRHDTSLAAHAIVGPVADKSILHRMPPERLYGFSEA